MLAARADLLRIPRPQVMARVATALDRGAVVLTAPAGFGKTWALQDALGARGIEAGWLRCTEDERDPGRFQLAFVDVLQRLLGAAAETLATGAGDAPLTALRSALRELRRLVVEPLVVVVDDAEALEGAAESLALLDELVRADPAVLRAAIATRRPLGLRLAKLAAAGAVTEIGRAELAFDAEECSAVMRARTGREPTADEVAAAMEASGGWPLGIALGGGGSFGFLAEEVLDRLDPQLRRAAVDSSLAQVVDERVTAALGLPADLLARLTAAGVFAVSPAGAGAFRYHPLFRDFLLERFATEGGGDEARRTLGLALDGPEAIELLLDSGAHEAALAKLASAGPALLRTAPAAVEGWVGRLAPDVARHPSACLIRGRFALLRGEEAALDELTAAVEGFAAAGDAPNEWAARLQLVLAVDTFRQDDVGAVIAVADGFERATVPGAAAVAAYAAALAAGAGWFDRWRDLDARIRAGAPPASALGYLEMARLFVLFPGDDPAETEAAIRRARRLLGEDDPFALRDLATFVAVTWNLETGRLDVALDRCTHLLREAAEAGFLGEMANCRVVRSTILLALGRADEARQELELLQGLETVGWERYRIAQARAQLALAEGDPQTAAAEIDAVSGLIGQTVYTDREVAVRTQARVLGRLGRVAEASALVEDALAFYDGILPGRASAFFQGRLHVSRAWLAALAGEDAAPALRDAVAVSGRALANVVRGTWWDCGAVTADHLGEVEGLADALLAAFPAGEELARLLEHPDPGIRARALPAAVASGRPAASRRARELTGDPDPGVAEAAAAALRTPAPPRIVEVLGGFSAGRGGWRAREADWGRPLASRLVRLLLTRLGEPVPEDVLAEAFWPEKDAAAARRNLQVNISHARAVLDLPGAAASCIQGGGSAYVLRLDPGDRVDAAVFEQAAIAAVAGGERAELEAAAALWTGEPMPEERYADWAIGYRERLTDRYAELLTVLAQARRRAGDGAGWVDAGRRLLAVDPLNEAAHRELMRAHASAGRVALALRQFLECRRILVDELGVEPSRPTADLHARILAGEPLSDR